MHQAEWGEVDIQQLAQSLLYFGKDKKLLAGQLWQKQTVVLVFLRHFACIACRAHASQVWSQREQFERKGIKLVFIGHGKLHWLESFRSDLGLHEGLILTDPSMASFDAAGLRRGFFNLVRPLSIINHIKLSNQGYSSADYQADAGDHFQMGGVLAIKPGSKLIYHFASRALGDFPQATYSDLIIERNLRL